MDSARGGYTIIEVFIVLAVSGAMLLAAIALFSGKQGQAQFNQAMQDLDSKIKSYVKDVGISVFPTAENYDECLLDVSDRPYLIDGSQTTGTNQNCIFLGKALQISPGSSTISVYSVLGNRTFDAGASQRAPVTTFAQVRPEPAVDQDGNIIASLVETYDVAFGAATLVRSWINIDIAANQNYDMAGFYNSLQASTVRDDQGSQSLLVKAYRAGGAAGVKSCIEEQMPPCSSVMTSPDSWSMCFRSLNGNETAILAIEASPAGLTTELTLKAAC